MLYLIQQDYMIHKILTLFCIFLEDEAIPIVSKPYSTISIPHPSMPAPNPTPVATPNPIFTRISRYFDVCKLVFCLLFNVIVCLFGDNNLRVVCAVCIN